MEERFLDRREASDFLTNKRGLKVARNTLQKLATLGGGPAYRKFGARVIYTIQDLDDWAATRLSARRHSTSETSAAAKPGEKKAREPHEG